MTINFKCSCGSALSVPDDSAGRDAWCATCRKKVPVPAGLGPVPAGAPDRREASEFKPGALARILGSEAPAAAAPAKAEDVKFAAPAQAPTAETKPAPAAEPAPAPAPAPVPAPVPAPPPAPAATPAQAPVIEIFPDKIKFHCACGQKVSVKMPAPHSAGTCPKCGRSLKVPKMPGDSAGRDGALRDRPMTKERFNCVKCGRLIEDLAAAFCPRCGHPLALNPPAKTAATAGPGVGPESPTPVPPSAQPPSARVRQRNAREAAEAAADLLRPTTARAEADQCPASAGLVRRMTAFILDLAVAAAVGLVAWWLAKGAGLQPPWHGALIGLAAVLVVNEVFFAAAAGGRSLGMLICGIGVFRSADRPAGLLALAARLVAWALLFIGAPLALFERQRRTLHDLICGTTVRQTSRE